MSGPQHPAPAVPLVVDLDGTLTTADVSLESFVRHARGGVLAFMQLIMWIVRGRSVAKAMVARRQPIDAAALPLRAEVVALIKAARAEGRPVVLATASHARNAARMARHTGLFTHVIGSTARRNLKGAAKLAALRRVFGDAPFDYVGDSRADIVLWRAARTGHSCNHLPRGVAVERIGGPATSRWAAIFRSLRLHQWAKNALVLVPLMTAGRLFDAVAVGHALLAALLFSLVASAIYQFNDILDIDADRVHPKKQHRPLAAGQVTIPHALALAAALLGAAFALSAVVFGAGLTVVLAVYLVLTTAYSFRLKAVMTLDVIALACLYTIRIVAGAVAIAVPLSFWLLLFSVFFFLSLGYLKRYTELAAAPEPGRLLKGRGYLDSDLEIVGMSGIAAGMVSILVMALFINDTRTSGLYASPPLLWGLCLCLLYWINRVWMMARRGQIDGDPVSFAIRDPRSIGTAALMAGIFVAARFVTMWPIPM
jgi:4-hydroxybenzoate polyprenyltransferase/phosphoserine phosphatase